jgi:hypothetical protein
MHLQLSVTGNPFGLQIAIGLVLRPPAAIPTTNERYLWLGYFLWNGFLSLTTKGASCPDGALVERTEAPAPESESRAENLNSQAVLLGHDLRKGVLHLCDTFLRCDWLGFHVGFLSRPRPSGNLTSRSLFFECNLVSCPLLQAYLRLE